ncbi:hypothetical protein [Pseudactinotalea sp.]|uniref:hypothetical protein n=1 Tax=Pseudactinotalea sp. TaxID=1926260 RepID=UPI003B3A29F1
MNRKYLSFIALAITILYGAGFAALDPTPNGYAAIGGAVVALGWISVGVFGKDVPPGSEQPAAGRPASGQPNDAPPYGTPPEDQR